MKNKFKKVIINALLLGTTLTIFSSINDTSILPFYEETTVQAATTGNDGAGRFWVKNATIYETGKVINSWQGQASAVTRQAKKVIIQKYGKVEPNRKYRIVYDTYSYPRGLTSRSGGISNVRVYK